jgi:hypothetical protein
MLRSHTTGKPNFEEKHFVSWLRPPRAETGCPQTLVLPVPSSPSLPTAAIGVGRPAKPREVQVVAVLWEHWTSCPNYLLCTKLTIL